MKLESNLINEEDFKVISEDCTLAQAFVTAENWCYDNNAIMDWWTSYKGAWSNRFFIECIKDGKVVNTFIISK